MEAQELSQKYAAAVFSQALEKWLNALQQLQEKLNDNASLAKELQDSTRSFQERKNELDKILPEEIDQHIRNFFYTMLKEGDLDILGDVIANIHRMVRGGPQVQVARITTAYPLSDEEKETFKKKLQQKYGQGLEFAFEVDSSVIGGAKVQIGDKIIDGTVATRMETMGNLLGVKK